MLKVMSAQNKGFTLIELMIAISIIAIISAIGLITYSKAQELGRDAKRKQDLQNIAKALQLYYTDNKRYPCGSSANEGFQTSSQTPSFWINDMETDGAGPCGSSGFDLDYTNILPVDPLLNSGNVRTTGRGYGYFGRGDCSPPYNQAGYFFALITRLENTNDPDTLGKKDVLWCDGATLKGRWQDDLYIITSL